MLGLYLLAAHLVGDFVFQTRWQAAGKFADVRMRMQHVAWYSVPFYAVLAANWPGLAHAAWFLLGLMAMHFLTDARRFRSTLGDVVAWRFKNDVERRQAWRDAWASRSEELIVGHGFKSLPANPWLPLPILIDQALHVGQLALLGGMWLS